MLVKTFSRTALSMIVLLPKRDNSLADLESTLSVDSLTSWTREGQGKEVIVSLPKFKISCRYTLNESLGAMGTPDAFAKNEADFSGMTGQKNLYIDAIIHKAFVALNEEGTEAAAATAVGSRDMSLPAIFSADHPFVFLIRHNPSKSILFIGRVVDPTT